MMGNGCDAIRKRGRSRAGLRARRAVGPFTAFCPACGGCHVSCRWNADWSGLPTRVERCHAVLITQRSQVQILPGYQVVEDRNHISGVEHRLDYDFAREAPQIMLCAYLYARLNPGLGRRQPRNWPGFVQQFCTHSRLHKPEAYDDLRQYLQITFGFSYESTDDLQTLVDLDQVAALAKQLASVKKEPQLARNDALLALAVYGRRRRRGETSRVTEFGWGTWWLTGETAIVKLTRDIVRENRGRYIMRPDFLLNFLTLAPSARTARKAFATVFPSMLGIRLARRMPAAAFDKIMDKMAEAEGLDDARRTVEINKLTNRLKSDFTHRYMVTRTARQPAPVDLVAAREASASPDLRDDPGAEEA